MIKIHHLKIKKGHEYTNN